MVTTPAIRQLLVIYGSVSNRLLAMTACCIPGQSRIALDLLSLPIGYYYLYKLFGVPAIVVSLGANVSAHTILQTPDAGAF